LLAKLPAAYATALFALCSGTAASQEFSADLVGLDADGVPATGRINVAGGAVRIETPEITTGFFVYASGKAYFVRPGQRVFMDAKQSSQLSQIFIPVDLETPCGNWQAMAKLSGAADNGAAWHCDHVGDEIVGERSTVVFKAVSPRQHSYTIWIDRKFGFPLRVRVENGPTYQLERIDEKPQLPELFTVPHGYVKFDPLKLIKRLKQSDVWVEPPR
jgi:hypothetical protein